MNPFKVGDIVKCIDTGSGVTAGKIYTITSIEGSDWCAVNDNKESEGNYTKRFELVKEVKELSTPVQKNERAVSDWGF